MDGPLGGLRSESGVILRDITGDSASWISAPCPDRKGHTSSNTEGSFSISSKASFPVVVYWKIVRDGR